MIRVPGLGLLEMGVRVLGVLGGCGRLEGGGAGVRRMGIGRAVMLQLIVAEEEVVAVRHQEDQDNSDCKI